MGKGSRRRPENTAAVRNNLERIWEREKAKKEELEEKAEPKPEEEA